MLRCGNRNKVLFSLLAGMIFLSLLLVLPSSLRAEPDEEITAVTAATASQAIDSASLEARISELQALEKPTESDTEALKVYQAALKQLKASMVDVEAAASFKSQIDTAGAAKAKLNAELKRLRAVEASPRWVNEVISLSDLEQRLDQKRAETKVIEGQQAELEALIANLRLRSQQSAEEIAAADLKLQETTKNLSSPEGLQDVLKGAHQAALLASQEATRSRISRLEMERLSSGPRLEQLRLEMELNEERLRQSQAGAQQLQELLSEKRDAEAALARRQAAEVERESIGKHSLIQEAAENNAELGRQLGALAVELKEAIQDRERAVAGQQRVSRSLERARQQLEIPRFDDSLGDLLRSHRKAVPDIRKLRNRLSQTERAISETRLAQFTIEDSLQKLLDETLLFEKGDHLQRPQQLDDAAWLRLKQDLDNLYQVRKELLGRLQATYERYEKALGDLEVAYIKQIAETKEYANLLEKSLVWMPSATPMRLDFMDEVVSSFQRLFQGERTRLLLEDLYAALKLHPLKVLSLFIVTFLLLVLQPRLRRALREMEPKVGNVTRDSFFLTFKALVITFLLSLPWVLLPLGLGLILRNIPTPVHEVASRILLGAVVLFALIQIGRSLLVDDGLAEVHFRWNMATVSRVRRYLRWFALFSIPAIVLIALPHLVEDALAQESLGRVVSILWLLALLFMTHRLISPRQSAISSGAKHISGRWSWRYLAYPLAMLGITMLMVLELRGYVYTATRFLQLLLESGLAALLIVLLYNLAVRWLLVAERRLAFDRARAKRQAAQEARAAKEAAEAAGESIQELPEMEEVALATISEQTRRLLRFVMALVVMGMLFLIWAQLTPALSKLDEIVLWERLVSGTDGDVLLPVSLQDLVLNILVIVLMIVSAKNLPGLLEITILQHLKLDRGTSYAVSKVTNYLIYGAGTVIAFSVIGLGWGEIQWLVAAMGVGLGFGLQEVFANFISGIIVLFERPVRIGDTVTIGNISGTVTRIRMRATTITDWDNKELIVPNKSFVTDPLINWTLSEETTRVVIRVGIAYGSDTELAHRLMTRVVSEHPDVLKEPVPTVFFLGFGESSLDFELRCFVEDRIKRAPLKHDLHMNLEKVLREAGIEIPFPQRDLHIRSADPGIFEGRPKPE